MQCVFGAALPHEYIISNGRPDVKFVHPWQAGEELDGSAIAAMKRLLATSTPRVRAYGGARFDAGRSPAPEWAEFGAYTFVLPRCGPSRELV